MLNLYIYSGEEQANNESGEQGNDNEDEDEGVSNEEVLTDPVDEVNSAFVVLTQTEQVTETDNLALQDELTPSHLHLARFELMLKL